MFVRMFVQCWNVCSKQTEGNHSQELEAADIGGRAGRGGADRDFRDGGFNLGPRDVGEFEHFKCRAADAVGTGRKNGKRKKRKKRKTLEHGKCRRDRQTI